MNRVFCRFFIITKNTYASSCWVFWWCALHCAAKLLASVQSTINNHVNLHACANLDTLTMYCASTSLPAHKEHTNIEFIISSCACQMLYDAMHLKICPHIFFVHHTKWRQTYFYFYHTIHMYLGLFHLLKNFDLQRDTNRFDKENLISCLLIGGKKRVTGTFFLSELFIATFFLVCFIRHSIKVCILYHIWSYGTCVCMNHSEVIS